MTTTFRKHFDFPALIAGSTEGVGWNHHTQFTEEPEAQRALGSFPQGTEEKSESQVLKTDLPPQTSHAFSGDFPSKTQSGS